MAFGQRHSGGLSDFKRLVKDEEVAKINKAVVEMGNHFILAVDEKDLEELLESMHGELTDERLLEPEHDP